MNEQKKWRMFFNLEKGKLYHFRRFFPSRNQIKNKTGRAP